MNSDKSVSCSFCKKDKNQTEILIAGDGAHICDVCIEKAHQIVPVSYTHLTLPTISRV